MIGFRKAGNSRQTGEVNMAPLIDMTFILLIFFMVSTTFVRDAQVDIERPGAASGVQSDQRVLRVTIDARGEIYVDTRPVKPWMVQSAVREQLSHNPIKTVLAVVDRRVNTGKLIEVVDQCRLGGAEEVGVAIDQEF